MIREAIADHDGFDGVDLEVYAKGSYANNTNVRADSDVDVAVECTECVFFDEAEPGCSGPGTPYEGVWTPSKLRAALIEALRGKFGDQVDVEGTTAIGVNSSSARMDADVVPCFSYRYYLASGGCRHGTKIFPTEGSSIVNYPKQQLSNGRDKNNRTNYDYKKAVRILKRIENAMVADRTFRELPSYFIECLTYNCDDSIFRRNTWTGVIRGALVQIWEALQGHEPSEDGERWLEANECFYLFHPSQDWTRADGREFALAAWNYLGFGDE